MRIAVVQTHPERGQALKNMERARALMVPTFAEIYVLPELAFSGYNFSTGEEIARLAEPLSGPTAAFWTEFCRTRKTHVVYGFPEQVGNKLSNSAALVGPSGVVGVYRKIHLFGREKIFFSPGEEGFAVWDIAGLRVGLLICFDWYFPESARTLALAGADILLHPSNLVLPHCPTAMVTRCLENKVFAATSDRVGTEAGGDGPLTFIGQSQIVSPRGELLARLGGQEESVAVADIDPALSRDKRLSSGNDLFSERRPTLYSL
ncbi:MAG: acyltransferase [Elusimicrobia bacterium]|jgi:predicted amidohydrolase|nr:acyltransferase [Elusimicrobiota bacterium]